MKRYQICPHKNVGIKKSIKHFCQIFGKGLLAFISLVVTTFEKLIGTFLRPFSPSYVFVSLVVKTFDIYLERRANPYRLYL
jgi:hypothetical protein